LVGKPWKSYSSISGRSFLHNWTIITGFTEDHAWDVLHIVSNTFLFYSGIM
jgi:hypothetical protein